MKKIIIIILIFTCGCSFKKEMCETNLFYMDTVINIKIYDNDKKKVNKAFNEIENIFKEYQKLTDYYNSNSDLSKLNNSSSNEIILDDKLAYLINTGLIWNNKSNGLLNINIGGVTKLWHDFRNDEKQLPTLDELSKIDTNINNIKLKDNLLIKQGNVNIDLGAITKGYVTQLAGDYLENIQLPYYIINAGGNVLVGKSTKNYYNIGIASPTSSNTNIAIIKAQNISVVTSGGYERFKEIDNIKYHHIIDPKTKYPATIMKSVTVIGKDSALCDIMSTILFLMDIESGQEFIKDYDIDVLWIDNNDKIIKSSGFKYE
ncbi:MAG: FAD:protein FMN transferase [Bacilli bacterium]